MNKKMIFIITIFSFFFFFTNNVKATTTTTMNIDVKEIKNHLFYSISEEKQEQYELAKNYFNIDTNLYDYIIFYLNDYLYCYKWKKNISLKVEPSLSMLDYRKNSSHIWLNFYLRSSTSYDISKLSYGLSNGNKNSSNVTNVDLNLVCYDEVNNTLYYDNISLYQIVETSKDLIFNDVALYDFNTSVFNPIRICPLVVSNITIEKGTILVKQDLTINIGNEYENIIDTTNINKIEFNFKIQNDNSIVFDLELLTQFSDIYLSKPYLQYTDIYDNVTISQIDDFLGERTKVGATDLNGNELYQYEGKFGIDFLDIKELKLIFDTSNYVDDLYIKFTSQLEYEVNYIYKQDVIDFYQTIMMDNIYALYLIPKTLASDNFSNISLLGKYNIEIRNNYISSESYEVIKTYKNYTGTNFQYKYTFNNLNYLIYFENTKYNTENDNNYYITFDTRYYNYSIKEFENDSPIIKNPNTDEEIKLPSNDSVDNSSESNNFLSNLLKNVYDKFPIIEQFYNIYNLYFNYNFTDNKPNMPKINLSFLGINQEYNTFDFTFYDEYRETIFNYIKLSLSIFTLFKLYKIVKGYFGGGKS